MRIWILIACLATTLPACGDGDSDGDHENDSCASGDNMGNPRIAEGFNSGDPAPAFRVLWDRGNGRGAELPDAYFDSARLARGTGAEIQDLVQSVEHSGPREITVSFDAAALTAFLATHTQLMISLEFRDRATVLDCTHPGMADAYFLDVLLEFESGALSRSQTNQRKRLGAI